MILFEVHHNKTFLKFLAPEDQSGAIKKMCLVFTRKFMPKPDESEYIVESIYDDENCSIPTPYLDILKIKLDSAKIEHKTQDLRKWNKDYLGLTYQIKTKDLWENQEKALAAITENNDGIIKSPTGTGKSRIIMEIVREKDSTTLILCPTDRIKNQLYEDACLYFGEKHCSDKAPSRKEDLIFQDIESKPKEKNKITFYNEDDHSDQSPSTNNQNIFADIFKDIQKTIAPEKDYLKKQEEKRYFKSKEDIKENSREKLRKKFYKNMKSVYIICYQSLDNVSRKFLEKVKCLIIDECHTGATKSIRKNCLDMPNCCFKFYLSATPYQDLKSKQELLYSTIGNKVIFEMSGEDAVRRELIKTIKHIIITPEKPLKNIYKLKNPRAIIEVGIIGNITRNISIVKNAIELYENNRNVFIAVSEIAHIKLLKERFAAQGIDAIEVHGELAPSERDSRIKLIGETVGPLISIGTMSVGIGTDMPNINAVIIGSGEASSIRELQRIGRGTRKIKGEYLIVIDYLDTFNAILHNRSKERIRAFNDEFGDSTINFEKSVDKTIDKYILENQEQEQPEED